MHGSAILSILMHWTSCSAVNVRTSVGTSRMLLKSFEQVAFIGDTDLTCTGEFSHDPLSAPERAGGWSVAGALSEWLGFRWGSGRGAFRVPIPGDCFGKIGNIGLVKGATLRLGGPSARQLANDFCVSSGVSVWVGGRGNGLRRGAFLRRT